MTEFIDNLENRIEGGMGKKLSAFIEKIAPSRNHLADLGLEQTKAEDLRERWKTAVKEAGVNAELALGKITAGVGSAVFLEKAGYLFKDIAYKLELPGKLKNSVLAFPFSWGNNSSSSVPTYGSVAFDVVADTCWRMASVVAIPLMAWAIPNAVRAAAGFIGYRRVEKELEFYQDQAVAEAGKSSTNIAVLAPPESLRIENKPQIESPKS